MQKSSCTPHRLNSAMTRHSMALWKNSTPAPAAALPLPALPHRDRNPAAGTSCSLIDMFSLLRRTRVLVPATFRSVSPKTNTAPALEPAHEQFNNEAADNHDGEGALRI